ncbi:MAG TPA: acyl carrier protein [Actinocrinis sp.]|uniref:acyl carrier protein n=1 Tax=Actinocrinis sp. TaxID=1920516 RepID=UPI002DDDB2E1|nr:acyl carrier protein [Actinocrinis sp.]HEV2347885.1 acyl carrier protein [Actinocrinis sp.]
MYDEFKQLLETSFRVQPGRVSAQATLEELELDSLDLVELSLMIQDRLGARVSDDELADLKQVGAIVGLIQSRAATV